MTQRSKRDCWLKNSRPGISRPSSADPVKVTHAHREAFDAASYAPARSAACAASQAPAHIAALAAARRSLPVSSRAAFRIASLRLFLKSAFMAFLAPARSRRSDKPSAKRSAVSTASWQHRSVIHGQSSQQEPTANSRSLRSLVRPRTNSSIGFESSHSSHPASVTGAPPVRAAVSACAGGDGAWRGAPAAARLALRRGSLGVMAGSGTATDCTCPPGEEAGLARRGRAGCGSLPALLAPHHVDLHGVALEVLGAFRPVVRYSSPFSIL